MVARFPPFPPLQASLLEVWALLRAAIKTAELYVRTSPGVYKVLEHSFGCFTPQKDSLDALSAKGVVEASPHFLTEDGVERPTPF